MAPMSESAKPYTREEIERIRRATVEGRTQTPFIDTKWLATVDANAAELSRLTDLLAEKEKEVAALLWDNSELASIHASYGNENDALKRLIASKDAALTEAKRLLLLSVERGDSYYYSDCIKHAAKIESALGPAATTSKETKGGENGG